MEISNGKGRNDGRRGDIFGDGADYGVVVLVGELEAAARLRADELPG